VVADIVKELGGKPFLTDANTLYVGGRKNALDHIESAYLNGFSPFSTGCHVLIADGLKGTDEGRGAGLRRAGQLRQDRPAVMDADIVISLNHFQGPRVHGHRRRAQEPWHGLRLLRGQDGDARGPESPLSTRKNA
jgi:uncharacterized Fe-S center protein